MDQGIIWSFKSNYRHLTLRTFIESSNFLEKIEQFDIRKAIQCIFEAWQLVKSETIRNCWKHSELIKLNRSTSRHFYLEIANLQHDINLLKAKGIKIAEDLDVESFLLI